MKKNVVSMVLTALSSLWHSHKKYYLIQYRKQYLKVFKEIISKCPIQTNKHYTALLNKGFIDLIGFEICLSVKQIEKLQLLYG